MKSRNYFQRHLIRFIEWGIEWGDNILPKIIIAFTVLGLVLAFIVEALPVSLFFSGFGGLAIYYIWDYLKTNPGLRIKNDYGEYEYGLLYLASALFLWVFSQNISFIFELLECVNGMKASDENKDKFWLIRNVCDFLNIEIGSETIHNRFWRHYIITIISSLNSILFLLAIRDFQISNPTRLIKWVKKNKWFRKKERLVLLGLLTCGLSTILYLFAFKTGIPYNTVEEKYLIQFPWMNLPDFALSIPTIIILRFFLRALFKQRKLEKFNPLVDVSLTLTLIAQVISLAPDALDVFKNDKIVSFISTSYQISLISIFFTLSFSWVARVRFENHKKLEATNAELLAKSEELESKRKELKINNKKLEAKSKQESKTRRAMNHMIRGTLRVLSLDLKHYHDNNGKLREARSRVDSMLELHNLLHEEKNTTEIDLKRYIEETSKIIICKIHDYKCYDDTIKIDTDIFCRTKHASDLATIIIELVTNAYKASFEQENPEKRNIKIRLYHNNNEALVLCVEDNGPGGVTQEVIDKGNYGLRDLLVGLVIEDFAGEITLNELKPHGTQFKVTIPLSKIKI